MNPKRPRAFLLQEDSPALFQRGVATEFGLAKAIIVQQLHYLLTQTNSGREFDGKRWIYNTYEEWQKQFFPYWSVECIKHNFQEMEKVGYVITCQPEGRKSRRKYYRLSDEWYVRREAGPDGGNFPPSGRE